jgi:prophage regulatory protein
MKPKEVVLRESRHKSFDDLPSTAYVRLNDLVPAVLPFSKATYFRKCKDGLFPKPTKLGERIAGNKVSEVREMTKAYDADKTEPEIRALVDHLHAQRLKRAAE